MDSCVSHVPRPAATVVIPVWNGWETSRRCLDRLRSTLGPRDRVVVVDNGSTDGTGSGLRGYGWVHVITNDTNRGFAAACNQGAAWADHGRRLTPVVVLLNNDTIPVGRWLDELLGVFSDPVLGAAGPRSNFASGPQLVTGTTYDYRDTGDLRAWVRSWESEYQGRTEAATRLVGFALAVRRSAWDQVGGFDEDFEIGGYEDDDLCNRLCEGGWRLLIVHSSYVHHEGHATFKTNHVDWAAFELTNRQRYQDKILQRFVSRPLLSACLIVRDEEASLAACLASVAGVVDEIVVHDTGSVDDTPSIAAAAGARIIFGQWHQDFGRARNEALAHCNGQWVLWIDADEIFHPAEGLRRALLAGPNIDFLNLAIDNVVDDHGTLAHGHAGSRIFRRSRARWAGRLHEQLVPRSGQPPLRGAKADVGRFTHHGYSARNIAGRDKLQRNLAVARLATVEDPGVHSQLTLGRTLGALDRNAEAVACYEIGRAQATTPAEVVACLRFGCQALLDLGDHRTALDWIAELRRIGTCPGATDLLEVRARRLAGDPSRSAELLEALGEVGDEFGIVPPQWTIAAEAELVAAALNEHGDR
jgi:GT2 family glycosyltransferase